jgi:hypothetical protein
MLAKWEDLRVKTLLPGLCMVLLTAASVSVGLAQRVLDPKSLVGSWTGEWSIPETGTTNRVRIVVKSVRDDGHVDGTIYMSGPAAYHNRDLKLVDASIRGSRLIFRIAENPNLLFDFGVNGSEMTALLAGTSGPLEFHLKR